MLGPTEPKLKLCNRCGEAKPLEEFYKQAGGKYGRAGQCRECETIRRQAYLQAHREERAEYYRTYRLAHLQEEVERHRSYREAHLKELAERRRIYTASRRSELAEYKRAWNRAHPGRDAAHARAYRQAHPDKHASAAARCDARNRGAVSVENVSRAVVYERDGGRCHVCGKGVDPKHWQLDHLMPLSQGGEHSYKNVAVAHPRCNLRRHNRGPAQLRLIG